MHRPRTRTSAPKHRGLHLVAAFEGQAPMALEALATAPQCDPAGWTLADGVLDLAPLLERLSSCTDRAKGANLFHGTLIAALAQWAAEAAETTGVWTVTRGGGCFLNRVLTTGLVERLRQRGLTPLTAIRVSPGDAGLSLGQAWIAGLSED